MSLTSEVIVPFNSPLETGLRSLCILVAASPNSFDLQQLIAFDYLVVHTGDIENAPPSLHPIDPKRNGELLVRRQLVERGLLLMESRGLIQKKSTTEGFQYNSDEFASIFLKSLTKIYTIELLQRARWVVKKYKSEGDQAFPIIFQHAFDRWAAEFEFRKISIRNEA